MASACKGASGARMRPGGRAWTVHSPRSPTFNEQAMPRQLQKLVLLVCRKGSKMPCRHQLSRRKNRQ